MFQVSNRLMETAFEHGTKNPDSNKNKSSINRRTRVNNRDPNRVPDKSPFRSARALQNANTPAERNCQIKGSLKGSRYASQSDHIEQSRQHRPSSMRRSTARSSRHFTGKRTQACAFRARSRSRSAFVPESKRRKLTDVSSDVDATKEEAPDASHASRASVSQKSTKCDFRRPSRYKQRGSVGVKPRPSGLSEVSKLAVESKVDIASGWEQNSTQFSIQDCHEAFIKAFAIPTHLYRYLAQRHRQRPLFLDRNLSYLRAPSSVTRTERSRKSSVNSVVERLRAQINHAFTASKHASKPDPHIERCIALSHLTSSTHWPQEVQLIFEGFFDSEKEIDWVTVEASVNLVFRFGWSWRHKVCSSDTLVSPNQSSILLACHNPARGLDHFPSATSGSLSEYRFCPLNVIEQAKWITSGSRLSSGQLELRVNAVERRWLKRRDLSRTSSLPNGGATDDKSIDQHHSSTHGVMPLKSRHGLSIASYPVYYATAPLPLFYPSAVSDSLNHSHPFLLTPGLYELRLGVDRGATSLHSGHSEKCTSEGRKILNGAILENGTHDSASTTDSLVTSTSDFPSGTVGSIDDVSSLNSQASGVASGRVEWRRVRFPRASDALDEYSRWPTLKFRVVWHGEASRDKIHSVPTRYSVMNGIKDGRSPLLKNLSSGISSRNSFKSLGRPSPTKHFEQRTGWMSTNGVRLELDGNAASTGLPINRLELNSDILPKISRPVAYRFLYMGHLQQWSESKNLICPWCQLDCSRARSQGLEALVVHLRSTHPRFRFRAIWGPSRTHLSLEVSLNEAYDGSNDCGLRRWAAGDGSTSQALITPGQLLGGWTGLGLATDREVNVARSLCLVGGASRVSRPIRRLPYTHLIFWRGTERSVNQTLDPTLSVRPMAVGHNRVYYHTRSVQPIRACEFDADSEAEDAPVWLCQHYQRKVEEFTDVNQGEKQIMQLWNALLLSIGPSQLVVCDNQAANLCTYFIHRHATNIHRRNLRNNLLLHFANLVDYGLLSTSQLRQLMTMYDKLISTHTATSSDTNGSRTLDSEVSTGGTGTTSATVSA